MTTPEPWSYTPPDEHEYVDLTAPPDGDGALTELQGVRPLKLKFYNWEQITAKFEAGASTDLEVKHDLIPYYFQVHVFGGQPHLTLLAGPGHTGATVTFSVSNGPQIEIWDDTEPGSDKIACFVVGDEVEDPQML
jgi:hypothetical protein